MGQGSRIEWADFARAFAILVVILCHSTESIFIFNLNYISSISVHSKIFAFSAFTFGRLGVPLFLMLSGYLLLDRSYNTEKTRLFWRNNWLHLFICTEIWFVVYEVFLVVYSNQTLKLNIILEDLLFIHKVNMSHVWYMPMILGMYVLFPLVSNILKQYELKDLTFPLLLFFSFSFGFSFLNVINNSLGNTTLSLQMSLGFSGGAYGIYFISGYISKKGGLKRVNSFVLVCSAFLSFIMAVLFQLWAYHHDYAYNIWYDCPLLFICAFSIFLLFSRVQKVPLYRMVKWISHYSFAIYLIYNMVISVVIKRIVVLNAIRPIKVTILWSLTTGISLLCAWLIGRIPAIGKYILYLK